MYKVLNQEGERIVVKTINPSIHRHLSGREFTENDACVKTITKDNVVDVIQEAKDRLEAQTNEVIIELNREQAIEAFKEKYGRKPSSKMKTENIIAKL